MSYNNGGSKAVSGGGVTSIEFDSGITITGSNRVLLAWVFVSSGSPTAWTNCRWGGSGGTAMTDFGTTYGTGTNYLRGRAFSLKDASIGSSSLTVYASGSAVDEVGIAGVGYTDIDQTDSWRTPTGGENEGPASISTTVTSASGETVVGGNYHAAASVQAPADEAGDQTRRQTATASAYVSIAVSDMAGATSVSFGFTFSDGHEYGAVQIIIPLKPASGGTTHNVSITEAASTATVQASSAAFAASRIDGVSASEIAAAASVIARSHVEGVSAIELQDGARVTAAAIIASVSGSDITTGLRAALSVSVVEAAAGASIEAATAQATVAALEAAGGSDIAAAAAVLVVARIDAATAASIESADVGTMSASIIEAASTSSSSSASNTAAAVIVQAAAGADIAAAAATMLASLVETAATVDVIDANMEALLSASIIEGASALDLLAAALIEHRLSGPVGGSGRTNVQVIVRGSERPASVVRTNAQERRGNR